MQSSIDAIPPQAKRKIGVVRLWPEKAAAEHENIERLRIAAAKIGVEIVEIGRNGCLLDRPEEPVDSNSVDFVLNLHYETPKNYDAYSYGALWNPLDFYFKWGYEAHHYHQLSHDGFASPGAVPAEDLVIRGRPREFRRGAFPILNHTLAEPIIAPRRRDDRRIFYCGINWDRLGDGVGRHPRLLKDLDALDRISIFGPEKIENIAPWAGYKNYRGQLPFDGASLVKAASDAGAVLVISSDMHKRSGIMSNRLFEALASGAVIIGDSHSFIAKHFADCVLTVDDSRPAEEQLRQIVGYLDWANGNPADAAEMATRAQQRFVERFRLDAQLAGLYRHHFSPRQAQARDWRPGDGDLLSIVFVPLSDVEALPENLVAGMRRQASDRFEFIAAAANGKQAAEFDAALAGILPRDRFKIVDAGQIARAPIGNFGALVGALTDASAGSIIVPVQGHETFFSTFVAASLKAFAEHDGSVAASTVLITHAHPVTGADLTDLHVTERRGPHSGAVAATLFRKRDYQNHRPLLDYLGADLWQRVILGGLLGPAFPTFVPQQRCHLPAYEARLRDLQESAPLVSAADGLMLVGSYRPPTGEALPPALAAFGRPNLSHAEIFDAAKYAALPIKQRQRFGAAVLRVMLVPRFIYRFVRRGGRLHRAVRRWQRP